MPAKGFYQFVRRVTRDLACTLPAPDRGPELDLR
jgi:hypothetical protein